jgi:hypothetical protein
MQNSTELDAYRMRKHMDYGSHTIVEPVISNGTGTISVWVRV